VEELGYTIVDGEKTEGIPEQSLEEEEQED
jgi:hypothetical protein